MPEYEKICMVEYANGQEDKFIWNNYSDPTLTNKINEINDLDAGPSSFDYIYNGLKTEEQELNCLLEALNAKTNFESMKEASLSK